MSTAKRIPNRLKFSMVMSDRSKLDGTLACSNEQWSAIWNILMRKPEQKPVEPAGERSTT